MGDMLNIINLVELSIDSLVEQPYTGEKMKESDIPDVFSVMLYESYDFLIKSRGYNYATKWYKKQLLKIAIKCGKTF